MSKLDESRQVLTDGIDAHRTPVHMNTYTQVRDYYKDKVGERGYIGAMAQAISPRQAGVKAKDDKPYLAARRSIERYEKGQFKNIANAAKVAEHGQQLPPTHYNPKGDTLTMTVRQATSTHKNSKGERRSTGYRDREFTVSLKGADGFAVVNSANPFRDILAANGYPDSIIDRLESGGSGEMEVVAVA